ncbi:hypothetical protein, partial [Roseospira marina]|uniref:hypothetical protein n=1 Tax=Roseospira marina TaxID=140057 RepID=UPI00147808D6
GAGQAHGGLCRCHQISSTTVRGRPITRTPPGGTLELPAAEAETLVARRLVRWASPSASSGTLPLTGGDDAVG